jgi:hypothetical protein
MIAGDSYLMRHYDSEHCYADYQFDKSSILGKGLFVAVVVREVVVRIYLEILLLAFILHSLP